MNSRTGRVRRRRPPWGGGGRRFWVLMIHARPSSAWKNGERQLYDLAVRGSKQSSSSQKLRKQARQKYGWIRPGLLVCFSCLVVCRPSRRSVRPSETRCRFVVLLFFLGHAHASHSQSGFRFPFPAAPPLFHSHTSLTFHRQACTQALPPVVVKSLKPHPRPESIVWPFAPPRLVVVTIMVIIITPCTSNSINQTSSCFSQR